MEKEARINTLLSKLKKAQKDKVNVSVELANFVKKHAESSKNEQLLSEKLVLAEETATRALTKWQELAYENEQLKGAAEAANAAKPSLSRRTRLLKKN